MSESIIERVARAICEAEYGEGATIDTVHVRQARAAIEAMMDSVTPAMLAAMEEMYMPFGEMRAAWDGACIAALNESDTILKGDGR